MCFTIATLVLVSIILHGIDVKLNDLWLLGLFLSPFRNISDTLANHQSSGSDDVSIDVCINFAARKLTALLEALLKLLGGYNLLWEIGSFSNV